ncbi:RNA polymerase factor sigma-54 [Clostridium sp.]|uniref:RNA polymerase factor sigma-54 n=1 Tax=Clostridium sp. TaxID=1506 RepID=UPI002FCBBF70
MNLDLGLRLTQEQKLVMTTEMQLSIKLLQMSSYELLQHIDKELQENIVLEVSSENPVENIVEMELEENRDLKNYKEMIKSLDYDNYSSRNYIVNDSEEVSPLNFVSIKSTLTDYLKEQLSEVCLDSKKLTICKYLVDSINAMGYLECDLALISKGLKVSMKVCEECLSIVQSLEPSGIGARNLSECLLIQIKRKGITDKHLEDIVANYLTLLSQNKYGTIAKIIGVTPLDVQKYCDIIKTLEPKPSRGFFTGEETSYIIPDAYIRKIDDEYHIIMNDSIIPNLNINNIYKDVINNSNDKVALEYVKGKINSAMSLIKSIDGRRNTLFRVIKEIINLQREYFDFGETFIKPMTIKNISCSLELHESTVSRAIRDKYVALNNGKIIKIKDLFSNSLNFSNEELSTLNIKKMIKEIIHKENEKKPLSDSVICNILNTKGLDISRRTIAKYREEMGIKSSTQRKRI